MFVNPETDELFRYGERIRPKEFCETLKMIAMYGGNYLYNGTLAKTFVSDIQEMGGIITEEDMANYRYMVTNQIMVKLFCNVDGYSADKDISPVKGDTASLLC